MHSSHAAPFFEQLSTMSRGGLSLRPCLRVLQERSALSEIRLLTQALDTGCSVAEAFATAHFSDRDVALIAAGERSGRLPDAFQRLALDHRQTVETRRRLLAPLQYPILVVVLTAFLMPADQFMENAWNYLGAVLRNLSVWFFPALGLRYLWKSTHLTASGQRWWLRVPFLGRVLRTTGAQRWVQTVWWQLTSGLPMPEAVASAWRSTSFAEREIRAQSAEAQLLAGEDLSLVLAEAPELPSEWIDYLRAGEAVGRVDESLQQIMILAENETQAALDSLTRWAPKIIYGIILTIVGWQIVSRSLSTYETVIHAMDSVMP